MPMPVRESHVCALIVSACLLASCAQPETRPQLSPAAKAQAREVMAHDSQELCKQAYASDPAQVLALTTTGSSAEQQCQCTYEMTQRLATEQQAVRYLRATAYVSRLGKEHVPTRPFWSLEDFHAIHHAAMHVCERHSEPKR